MPGFWSRALSFSSGCDEVLERLEQQEDPNQPQQQQLPQQQQQQNRGELNDLPKDPTLRQQQPTAAVGFLSDERDPPAGVVTFRYECEAVPPPPPPLLPPLSVPVTQEDFFYRPPPPSRPSGETMPPPPPLPAAPLPPRHGLILDGGKRCVREPSGPSPAPPPPRYPQHLLVQQPPPQPTLQHQLRDPPPPPMSPAASSSSPRGPLPDFSTVIGRYLVPPPPPYAAPPEEGGAGDAYNHPHLEGPVECQMGSGPEFPSPVPSPAAAQPQLPPQKPRPISDGEFLRQGKEPPPLPNTHQAEEKRPQTALHQEQPLNLTAKADYTLPLQIDCRRETIDEENGHPVLATHVLVDKGGKIIQTQGVTQDAERKLDACSPHYYDCPEIPVAPLPPLPPLDIQTPTSLASSSHGTPQSFVSTDSPVVKATKSTSKKSKKSSSAKPQPDKKSQEYFLKRERNNIAVRKSREKAKKNFRDLQKKELVLQEDNAHLEAKIVRLTEEVGRLRALYLSMRDSGAI